MIWVALSLAASTLVSEDAAALGGGVLARTGGLPVPVAVAAVALGIWAGDVGLFAAGRLARTCAPVNGWARRKWPAGELDALAHRLEGGAPAAIFASRVLPGTRVALYVAAGLFRIPTPLFVACTGVAALAWAGAIVLGLTWLAR